MSAVRVLVVDDEPLARQRLTRLLENQGEAYAVETAADGVAAVAAIRRDPPDVVLLDVKMPGLSGFDVLRQVPDRRFKVVFVTAYDAFAVRAFEESACDYLLKPVSAERFAAALTRVQERLASEAQLARLEQQLDAGARYLERLVIRERKKLRVVAVNDVRCFVSRDHYTLAYTANEELICDLSLTQLVGQLDPRRFRRLHRHNVVNIAAVVGVTLGPSMMVDLDNHMRLAVSRNNRGFVRSLGY